MLGWKLLTKHIEYKGYSPHHAFQSSNNHQDSATATDMGGTSGYDNNVYLKNIIIDFWGSLGSKKQVSLLFCLNQSHMLVLHMKP